MSADSLGSTSALRADKQRVNNDFVDRIVKIETNLYELNACKNDSLLYGNSAP